MKISELLVPEFDTEMAVTCQVLMRVPDDRAEWKPHVKAFPMGHLAQLVAGMPGWLPMMFDKDELDIKPVDGPKSPDYSFQKTEKLLADFDRNVATGRAALQAVSDEALQQTWTLKSAGKVLHADTRYQMLRTTMLNHMVHHRAQLGMYLRLTDQKVPEMYGPTADE